MRRMAIAIGVAALRSADVSTVDARWAQVLASACGSPVGGLLRRAWVRSSRWRLIDTDGVNDQPCDLIERLVPRVVLRDLRTPGETSINPARQHRITCVTRH